jgi:hypothetical protein
MTADSRCARYQPVANDDGGRERSLELAERRHRDVKAFLERAKLSAADLEEPFRSAGAPATDVDRDAPAAVVLEPVPVRPPSAERHAPYDLLPRVRRYLGAERAKYLDAIEDIRVAYVATNLRGIVVEANTVAASIFGSVPLVDRALIGFVARRDTRAFRSVLKDLATQEREEVGSIHLHMRRRGGPVFSTVVSGRVVYGLAQHPVIIRWLVQPVSA